uniref:RNA-directed DNA polymerase n=1 Tax=Heterorhabditis bacteriophora TaxID=37862 RepID=A0A1I7WNX9_HETBA
MYTQVHGRARQNLPLPDTPTYKDLSQYKKAVYFLGTKTVLETLHEGHPGMIRMKMLARNYVYWTNIDGHIEGRVRECTRCQESSKNPVKNTLHPWPSTSRPWSRIHIDYAGPLEGRMYLIIETNSSTTTAKITILLRLFAQFGLPETIVSDNGTQFTDYCVKNGIKHVRSPLFPRSQMVRLSDSRLFLKLRERVPLPKNYTKSQTTEWNTEPDQGSLNQTTSCGRGILDRDLHYGHQLEYTLGEDIRSMTFF